MFKKENIVTVFKGLVVGGTMLVPGVSGGSMAMILGIYNKLVSSVSTLTKDKKNNILFLTLFVIGAGIGMVLFAKPLLMAIETYPKPLLYFFMGAVAGGIPLIYRESGVKKFSLEHLMYIQWGILIVLLVSMLPLDIVVGRANMGVAQVVFLVISGIVAAVALVLPGISVSYLLLIMGLYDKTMHAISEPDIGFLIPLAAGVIIGVLLVTKVLDNAMTKYPKQTYLIILGFVLASLAETFPGIPSGMEWIICIATAIVGYAVIRLISKFETIG